MYIFSFKIFFQLEKEHKIQQNIVYVVNLIILIFFDSFVDIDKNIIGEINCLWGLLCLFFYIFSILENKKKLYRDNWINWLIKECIALKIKSTILYAIIFNEYLQFVSYVYIFHPFIQLFRIPEVNCCTGDESCLWQRIRNIKMYATPKHKIYSRQRLFTVDVKLVSILQPKYETRVAKKG